MENGRLRKTILALLWSAGALAPALGIETSAPETQTVAIDDFAFTPARIEARAGDTVMWTNGDLAPHTATADDDSWSTDPIKNGATGQFVAASPGTYGYHCAFHPEMRGVLVVTARPVPRAPLE
jgi:plastocyanin